MGSYKLIITDFKEKPCDESTCKRLANQYRVTVTDSNAIVEKYCYEHYESRGKLL